MVDKDVFMEVFLEKARKLEVGYFIDIRTYKRNRSVLLIRKTKETYCIIENGFFRSEFETAFNGLKRLFKKILKREFPHSHKIRLYNMGLYSEEKAKEIARKKI